MYLDLFGVSNINGVFVRLYPAIDQHCKTLCPDVSE